MKSFIALALLAFFSYSCHHEQPTVESVPEYKIQKVLLTDIKLVDSNFDNFDNFLKSESYEILKTNISNINIKSIHAVSFDDNQLKGFIVRIEQINGADRDLMTVYKTKSPKKFTTLLRESTIKVDNEKLNGTVAWYTATYDKINEMTVNSNKISSFHLFTSNKPFSTKNARFASIQDCNWQCTAQDFNCEYQRAKSECENDWSCDFACSFNPCALAYLASAIKACTNCNYE